jgi:hypothetical protein
MVEKEAKEEFMPFNAWSRSKIMQGKKFCTSRTRIWNDPRSDFVIKAPLWAVKKYLFYLEGAESPEEFESVWRSIFKGKFEPEREVFVHFGDYRGGK